MRFLDKMTKKITTSSSGDGEDDMQEITTLYDISLRDLQGKDIALSKFKGKHILFVNVASKCGFTGQYKDLQQLYDTCKASLEIVGVPCNQFGSQEPGNADAIQSFCERNYGVSFTMTEKLNVKGPEQHNLYKWLTQKKYNTVKSSSVKWNFQKYLIDHKGQLVDVFYSITKPNSAKITKHLK